MFHGVPISGVLVSGAHGSLPDQAGQQQHDHHRQRHHSLEQNQRHHAAGQGRLYHWRTPVTGSTAETVERFSLPETRPVDDGHG
ncbi:MAG: hypothetical protein VB858_11720 [Planctomycetaceae bacterium]